MLTQNAPLPDPNPKISGKFRPYWHAKNMFITSAPVYSADFAMD